jgi:hypothetical protein
LGHIITTLPELVPNVAREFSLEIGRGGKLLAAEATIKFTLMFEPFDQKIYGEQTVTYHKELELSQFDDALIEKVDVVEMTYTEGRFYVFPSNIHAN